MESIPNSHPPVRPSGMDIGLARLEPRWSALADAAQALAAIADTRYPDAWAMPRTAPILDSALGADRFEIAVRGIDDLTALMETGLSALLAALAQGSNPRSAAQALLHEFHAARLALGKLIPELVTAA